MKATILEGHVLDRLAELPDNSVHCVVTSPPYWGLRDYGIPPATWPDGWVGCFGLEPSPDMYVRHAVIIFREVRRVLRKDGVLWLNIGDCYAAGGNGGHQKGDSFHGHLERVGDQTGKRKTASPCLKPKDIVGIPWMLAFALRGDGWWLRGDHVWGKPNGMPESTGDRPTRSHEYVFLLSKSEHYFYNAEAVRTAPKASTATRLKQDTESQTGSLRANGGAKTNGTMKAVARRSEKQRGHGRRHVGFNDRWDAMTVSEQMEDGANLRSIWWISPAQYEEAHFAVMPERLAQICILSGCPEDGTVLDPFSGSGTVGTVALRHHRNYIGIELNPEYVAMSEKRIHGDAPMFNTVEVSA